MAKPISGPVKAFLEKPNFAVLATRSPSGRVQATPVWFIQEDGDIVINTSAGRKKLRNMEADPRVTLVIMDRENPYKYVQIQGRVVQFDKESGAKVIDRLSQRYHGRPYQYPGADRPEKRITIRIKSERESAQGF